jgi:pyruvate kinase
MLQAQCPMPEQQHEQAPRHGNGASNMTERAELARLRASIAELETDALEQEERLEESLVRLHPSHLAAGRNLAHYLALRQHDLRDLQRGLAALGLSSLGRAERCVMATLGAVGHALACLASDASPAAPREPPTHFDEIDGMLEQRTSELLGPMPTGRSARIMLTLPTECDASAIDELLAGGADVMRINCAKGTVGDWQRTIERVRQGARRRGHECRVLCDLAGPNPRTLAFDGEAPEGLVGRVSVGDYVRLSRTPPSEGGQRSRRMLSMGCTLPSVIADLLPGERVFYDDGKFSGVVRQADGDGALIEVTSTRKERIKVKPQKGLNFPDSKLNLPSLTPKDLQDLRFVVEHADMVGLSFVRGPQDVEALQAELARLEAPDLGVVLKIETAQAFQALPHLLLTALRSARVGIMVARGDMAMELGFERLAEAQEEVLWLSEAAFVPVIWATQVLDNLSKTGVPSRAEVTDAAMGGRAECVMLNQGEHQLAALRFLCDVLERMQNHHEKKRAMLRKLRISSVD